MRRSSLQHTVAVLRSIIGLRQADFAKMVSRSARSIQSVELGTLKLSNGLAERIGQDTDINLAWLLDNNIDALPVDSHSKPYTFKTFERVRANKEYPAETILPGELAEDVATRIALMLSRVSKKKLPLFEYKLRKALAQLEKECCK